tara:strand:+ start:279 stop:509 length:231 start_codon:yes stop_codon:yes gene_type:complete
MNDKYFDKISKIISKHTKVKEEFINLETSAETIDRWDSLAHINIIVDIEKEFNVKIKTAKVAELNSIKSITQFLNK